MVVPVLNLDGSKPFDIKIRKGQKLDVPLNFFEDDLNTVPHILTGSIYIAISSTNDDYNVVAFLQEGSGLTVLSNVLTVHFAEFLHLLIKRKPHYFDILNVKSATDVIYLGKARLLVDPNITNPPA